MINMKSSSLEVFLNIKFEQKSHGYETSVKIKDFQQKENCFFGDFTHWK